MVYGEPAKACRELNSPGKMAPAHPESVEGNERVLSLGNYIPIYPTTIDIAAGKGVEMGGGHWQHYITFDIVGLVEEKESKKQIGNGKIGTDAGKKLRGTTSLSLNLRQTPGKLPQTA